MNYQAVLINVSLLWLLTTPHEFAHAWVATMLGDDTPRREGRLTLNPLAHVDWLGTTILPALTSLLGAGLMGWGKPVNTNPSQLRWGLKGLALVALAGPASNVVLAVLLAGIAVLAGSVFTGSRLILRARRAAQPLPGDLQSAAGAAARWLETAVGRQDSLFHLRRIGPLWIRALDRRAVSDWPGRVDVHVER